MFDTYHLPRKNTRYLFIIFTDICGEDRTSPAGDTDNLRCPPGLPPGREIDGAEGHYSLATARKGGPMVKDG